MSFEEVETYPIFYGLHPITYHYFKSHDPSSPFKHRVLLMSDLHSNSQEVVDILDCQGLLKDTVVIATGDMAGDGTMGGDGDPLPVYQFLLKRAKRLYFVQGNHDLFNPDALELKNSDQTYCCLHNRVQDTIVGRLGGVNGIMGKDKPHKHTFLPSTYLKLLNAVLQQTPDILLTHDPLFKHRHLLDQHQLPTHLFGHCHLRQPYVRAGCTHSFNLDGRVVLVKGNHAPFRA